MSRGKAGNLKFLEEKYLNKEATVVLDVQGYGDMYLGCMGRIMNISYGGERSLLRMRVTGSNNNNPNAVPGTEIVVFCMEIDLTVNPEQKVRSLEKRKKVIEDIDRYGNEYIIELYKDGEDVIYLSSALRTLIGITDKDKVGFAIDRKAKKYYIFKEDDDTIGHAIKEGKVKNNVEWRNLYNTFNPETQNPDKGKLKFHISHYLEKNTDFPEYVFFLINEPWYEKKVEKPVLRKVVDKGKSKKEVDPSTVVGSPEWLQAQMEARENRGFRTGTDVTFTTPTTFTTTRLINEARIEDIPSEEPAIRF